MSSQEAALDALATVIKGVYRTVLAGYLLATSLYGITILQTFFYFRHYSKDRLTLKLIVLLLWSLDTVATGLVTASLYTYLIQNFGKPILEVNVIPLPFAVENGITTAVIWVVQLFFAGQIWLISKNKAILFIIVSFSLAAFALGIRDTFLIFQHPSLVTLAVKKENIIRGVIKGITVLADIVIASSLIFFFQSKRTGIKRSENILDQLILYAASRGALLTLTQILYFALFTAFPNHTYWQPVHQMVSKVYVNSVLTSLNARKSFEKVKGPVGNSFTNINTTSFTLQSMRGDVSHGDQIMVTKEVDEEVDGQKIHLRSYQ
jgi:hypothetical protein